MYRKFLTVERIRPSSRGPRELVEEVESDRSRVLYSAAFRRLQRKTQVFPLENNAAVRTRLTHSLEVAHVGRFIAGKVLDELEGIGAKKAWGLDGPYGHAFTTNVEVACLLHDIGNPPFGHFGEIAVSKWFGKFTGLSEEVRPDFERFDGNAQGFRIVSKLAGSDGKTGMNLTLTQLASILKYPTTSNETTRFKKFGVFQSEKDVLLRLRQQFDLKVGQRFPLAYLMEAADDISYCLSDIEDGVEKGIVTFKGTVESLRSAASGDPEVAAIIDRADQSVAGAPAVDDVVSFRSSLIRQLVEFAAKTYVAEHDAILEGEMDDLIASTTPQGRLLKYVKTVVRTEVYSHPSVQSLELAGLSVITGLLDHFGPLLSMPRSTFAALCEPGGRPKGCDVEKRLFDFFARRHRSVYEEVAGRCGEAEELASRARLIVDYISGMTDHFALDTHQVFGGIRI